MPILIKKVCLYIKIMVWSLLYIERLGKDAGDKIRVSTTW